MSLKKIILIPGFIFSQLAIASVPVEVIDSCKNDKAANSSVAMTALTPPHGLGADETGCLDHFESTVNGFNYGYITCNDKTSLILKGNRFSLDTAVNHSINPAITPGKGHILPLSDWWKITYANTDYLCISTPLSSSGKGDNILQHYIVENAYNSNIPILNFYFFNKDIIPLADM
ncbi:hypothetical protein Lrub_1503 [Legionella rubrilucens]|uniref:Uncharacterized protein n=1 Tax=Legionella rubrilucens TaxID=458 RepID=A0A0W0XTD1_9GAMM|nr:hypothetical protein [Legionella rubrilucens]KTD48055.1 hypothetical protein Lrub_1503 [Legionella rubrilucens]